MADNYDRYEGEGGGGFIMGLLAGTVLGAGLGMLFAPKAGTELRNQLSEQAGRLKTTAGDTYAQATDKVSHLVDRGREAYDRARSSVIGGGDGSTTDTTGPGTTGTPGTTNTGSMTGAGTGYRG